ncbi:MAG TPA: VWA domain-containing protein [Deltaproteobacteria bacterium]|nr:VWA domain-containing protein [Deltaproteobacteria bacterium]
MRRLIEQGLLYDIRFAIVSYSGPGIPWPDAGSKRVGLIRSARLRMPLTRDARQLQSALDGILERGSEGSTVFYAGMRRANRLLESVTDPSRRRLALFISDSPRSVSPGMTGEIRHVDPRLKIAAITARDRKIVFHTFGLSPESGAWRRKTLGRIAGATGGAYHPVEDPDLLYCHLVQALQRPGTNPLRRGVFAGTESEVRKDGPGRRPDDSSGFDAQGSTGPAEGDLLALETDS